MSKKTFIEDKSAKGIYRVNPKTGLTARSPEDWAAEHIFDKSVKRIESLANDVISTRPTKGGSPNVPSLEQIKNFRKLHFRINFDDPRLVKAVENEMNNLSKKYQKWEFSAEFNK